ncbi:MAG: lipolytic protein G-D-S-L family [Alistipes sp.]|nr:lipolytic protein G-D-S-L family [Alistipes sp.]
MKRLVLAVLFVCLAAGAADAHRRGAKRYRIVFIGDSITFGAGHADRAKTAPPVFAAGYVSRMLGAGVEYRNCGRSGATTVDFLPERGSCFKLVESAVAELQSEPGEPLLFAIMLGTNDSATSGPTGSPVSNEDYERNMLAIIERLRELAPGASFVLQRPIWYTPNTYNGAMYLVAGQKRLAGYADVLLGIAERNGDVCAGDFDSYDSFRRNHRRLCIPENGNAGVFYLHPNEIGARKLARRWARAIVDAIETCGR